LSDEERILLGRLGVFVGGFDLSAAEQVCGTDTLGPDDVLDLLASLVDKSLVMFNERGDSGRYRMLETIREYAREKLEAKEELQTTAARHCEYYFELSKRARDGITGPEQAEWIGRLEVDLDNVREQWRCAVGRGGIHSFGQARECSRAILGASWIHK